MSVIIGFSNEESWSTGGQGWGRARAKLAEQGMGHGTIVERGVLLGGVGGRVVIETAEALLVSAREWVAEDQARGEDSSHLMELVSLLEAEVAEHGASRGDRPQSAE